MSQVNDSPQGPRITPGMWIESDLETLLNLQLQARGVDFSKITPEDIRKRLVQHVNLQGGEMVWTWDDQKILTFRREMCSELVLGYSMSIERLIVPAKILKLTH